MVEAELGRILAIDYGGVRTGFAVTDPLRIIASALTTVPTKELLDFLDTYLKSETVITIVIGDARQDDGSDSHVSVAVEELKITLEKKYPSIKVTLHDEHLTSARAKQIILSSGARKKQRRDKKVVDKVAASLILQDYMDSHNLW